VFVLWVAAAEPCNKVALSHTVSQRLSRSRLQGKHGAGALGFLGHWRMGVISCGCNNRPGIEVLQSYKVKKAVVGGPSMTSASRLTTFLSLASLCRLHV
jgi:hypothetical protein